jgi:ABC-type transporter Mla maintaining outer membrane lipid asymmetry ATPase subunit MlaF
MVTGSWDGFLRRLPPAALSTSGADKSAEAHVRRHVSALAGGTYDPGSGRLPLGQIIPIKNRRADSLSPHPYLQFKNISVSFPSKTVLDQVSFEVPPGKTMCILGKSGVGKSVSLRILMGFLKPDSGRVIAAGEDITDYAEEELRRIRRKVTMVFQDGALFDSLTVAENIAFPLRERGDLEEEEEIERIIDGLLEMVGLRSVVNRLPSGISTGMKRSVAIARALAAQPEAILYDEPTTMTDPLTARRLTRLIRELKTQLKLTSVVVTHDMKLMRQLADHVVFLDQARVVFQGTVKEMERSRVPIVQEFLRLDYFDPKKFLLGESNTEGRASGSCF